MRAGRAVLHSLPIGYSLDEANGIRDPRGMVGRRFGIDMHVMTSDIAIVRNLMLTIDHCHLDVGAKAEIHRLMSGLASKGMAILMISSELPEVLGMSDRILVMRAGRIVKEVDRADATQAGIAAAMMSDAPVSFAEAAGRVRRRQCPPSPHASWFEGRSGSSQA